MRRVIVDQGLPPSTAVILRQNGWDAVHLEEIDMSLASDSNIIELAAKESRTVVTLDQDFPNTRSSWIQAA